MKIEYINEYGRKSFLEKGSHIILESPLGDSKIRHAYVLSVEYENNIIVQMLTSSDRKKTGVLVEINGKLKNIRKHYQVKIDITKNKVLKTKSDTIDDEKINEIKKAADQSVNNALGKGICCKAKHLVVVEKLISANSKDLNTNNKQLFFKNYHPFLIDLSAVSIKTRVQNADQQMNVFESNVKKSYLASNKKSTCKNQTKQKHAKRQKKYLIVIKLCKRALYLKEFIQ